MQIAAQVMAAATKNLALGFMMRSPCVCNFSLDTYLNIGQFCSEIYRHSGEISCFLGAEQNQTGGGGRVSVHSQINGPT
jgi:hypothetical protein